MKSAEIVIVGAGVVGASIAYHLAARGCSDVLVLERDAPGNGSTGRATGGFRCQFTTEVNTRLSLLSRAKLERFRDELGVDAGYHPCGYLFLARDGEQLAALREARRVQHAAGLAEAREVDLQEIELLNPAVRLDGVAGGAFCPTDGFLRPARVLEGYLRGAERLGVRFAPKTAVTGFDMAVPGRVAAVRTAEGRVVAGSVVNAAGAWAGEVARLAGCEVPVRPLRRQVAATAPCDLLPQAMPMTVFLEDGFHLRVRDGRVLLLWPADTKADGPFDTSFDDAWLGGVVARAHARVPCLRKVEVDATSCWAGLYEMSPDGHALLGPSPGMENFYLANGSSGHGVMHAPALGHLLAEIILDGRASTVDVRALRPSRFLEGEPNLAPELL
jgi:sarcosine oxidase subunit beta